MKHCLHAINPKIIKPALTGLVPPIVRYVPSFELFSNWSERVTQRGLDLPVRILLDGLPGLRLWFHYVDTALARCPLDILENRTPF